MPRGKKLTPTVSEKNKKGEVLEAYYDLLEELKAQKEEAPVKEKQEREKIVEVAKGFSLDEIIKGLAGTKLSISKCLESLETHLLEEYKKFIDLQKSVDVSKKELEELHDIRFQTGSLEALIETQRRFKEETDEEIAEEKESFEEEMARKKAEWKEEKETTEKERAREEEAYLYDRETSRKKEKDAYEEKKQTLEKELQEKVSQTESELEQRERELSQKEKHLEGLTAQVEGFPEKLDEAVEKTRTQVQEEVQKQYQFEIELSKKEADGQKTLYEQKIASLQLKIKEQHELIKQLTERVDESGRQVQDIAVKAVESASQTKALETQWERTRQAAPKE
ncbi:hypothetical protein [Candidatus Neptunochlamydia vexilliferae]|uniref:Myosin heavy chain n=1 Tax=Candidatus Neptunichlamydia vexilliferae TaxID=1651774 RepID=A0ABS0B0D4_9BACT|nr:hypothetical protein [Candidatus Neptunochlamydia vexilliferae]MBF5059852.1 hypothetical protein [Candidatus Neptunochlamydia vexilliferae]